MKRSMFNVFSLFFVCSGSFTVIYAEPRFLTQDHYVFKVQEYLKTIKPTHASVVDIDLERLSHYLSTRVNAANRIASGGQFVKPLEVIALTMSDDNQFLHT